MKSNKNKRAMIKFETIQKIFKILKINVNKFFIKSKNLPFFLNDFN